MNTQKKQSLIRNFFFAEEVPFGMAIVRIIAPLTAGIAMWYRFPRVRELFTTDGATVQLFELFGNGPQLPVFSPQIAVPLYGIMLLCMFLAVIGFRTRLSLCVATPLFVYFNLLDSVGTMTKYSVIGSHLLLLLTVSDAGAIWSVDAYMARRKNPHLPNIPPKFPVWPARLMQLLFCFLYFGAAITKIQTDTFFSGEQMRSWMLSNWNYNNPVGEILAMWSPVLLISAYLAVIWETLFAFLVFQKRTRLVMLGAGVFFHFMTWVTLGLKIFPLICVSGYFSYIMQDDFLWLRQKLSGRFFRGLFRSPFVAAEKAIGAVPKVVPAGVAWTCLIAFAAIASTEAELQMDLYGRNAPEGKPELPKMSSDVALAMIRDKQPIREHDKFFSFDIGTFTIGEQLANRRSEFTYGQQLIAQCNLNPPHEDMWLECLLQDSEGRNIEQFGQFVTREKLRANFFYIIGNKLQPGNYSLVLRSDSKDIYRRPFRLVGTPVQQTGSDVLTN